MTCTAQPCRNRRGLCSVSLLCGCACHALAAVSTAPSGQSGQGGGVVDPDVFQYRDAFGHIVTSNSPAPQPAVPAEGDDTEVEEELSARERAELLIAGSLAVQMSMFPTEPVRITRSLLEMLERHGLRIIAA